MTNISATATMPNARGKNDRNSNHVLSGLSKYNINAPTKLIITSDQPINFSIGTITLVTG